jgi:RNA polymerase sigma factor (sigma-70 family)
VGGNPSWTSHGPGDGGRGVRRVRHRQRAQGLGRLAYLLVADAHAADDLVVDVLLATWRQWDQVRAATRTGAYLRQVMVNQAAARHKRAVRERLGLERLHGLVPRSVSGPDSDVVVDVQTVLKRIPLRRRACLVLRYAFDLSDREVAELLGVSIGTVKSQTSKAAAHVRRELDHAH